ncbi:cell envelope-related Asp23 family protein [Glaciihabitans tibetensis]|uniref:Cell envelope-related Asp23 family protein n=1 Tax=Glaciihabitans tibetensis TaxID=1266600 RepID=A0A2T0V3D7_9MICO|nr:Asp23/Gls24 family envelope stress response protein [Glaciihabitans tibetensis]PRY64696.1 cell envelope-related Asp23 family protein [Glaciihabitans tibetensis]
MTDVEPTGLDPEDLDGHTMDELSDYLDAGRRPRDESIESSPGCRIALDALARLRSESWAMLEGEALPDSTRNHAWIKTVLANISRESRAGRAIPISHPEPDVQLRMTEGSVRGLIRAAGDAVGGALIGKVDLEGDVSVPGEDITVSVTASVPYGENLTELAQRIRESIAAELLTHTELNVTAVNVTVDDIHTARTAPPEETR